MTIGTFFKDTAEGLWDIALKSKKVDDALGGNVVAINQKADDILEMQNEIIEASSVDDIIAKAYESGKTEGHKENYDSFWDAYQQNGNRTKYELSFAGRGWTNTTFKPKYPMQVSNAFEMFRDCGELDLVASGANIDFSKCTSFVNFANSSGVTRFGVIDTTSAVTLNYAFHSSSHLVSIEKIILKSDGNQQIQNMFSNCSALEEMRVEGVIASSIDLSACPLTLESAKSVINHLKYCTGTDDAYAYTVQFSDSTWALLDADIGVNVYEDTYYSWEYYITEGLCWSISR